jgi:PAS domain S-box-containing protein
MSSNEVDKGYLKSIAELEKTIDHLHAQISELEKRQSITYEDALKLAILDRAPFTMWACDRNYKIVLWTKQCEQNYGFTKRQALGKDFIELFVSEPEKADACEDTVDIIDSDKVFSNFIAEDVAENGAPRYMLTNCFRIWDEENKQWLQAEVALEISDIDAAIKDHRNLREAGIALVAQKKRYLELEQKDLGTRVRIAYVSRLDSIKKKQEQLDGYIVKLRRDGNTEAAESLRMVGIEDFERERVALTAVMEELLYTINHVDTIEKCIELNDAVENYEKEGK